MTAFCCVVAVQEFWLMGDSGSFLHLNGMLYTKILWDENQLCSALHGRPVGATMQQNCTFPLRNPCFR
jgi:hypothetical protein